MAGLFPWCPARMQANQAEVAKVAASAGKARLMSTVDCLMTIVPASVTDTPFAPPSGRPLRNGARRDGGTAGRRDGGTAERVPGLAANGNPLVEKRKPFEHFNYRQARRAKTEQRALSA